MSVLDTWARLLRSGLPGRISGIVEGRDVQFTSYQSADTPGIENFSVEQLWASQPHLRTTVGFAARNIAQLGLHLFDDAGDERNRVRTGTVAELLKRPNDYMTRYELFYALVTDLMLYDEAYLAILPGPEVHVIPSNWITPVYPEGALAPAYYQATNPAGGLGSPAASFGPDEIVAWRGWTPGAPERGTSPVQSLRLILEEQYSARKHRVQVWKRNGRIGSYVTRPSADGLTVPKWTDADRKRFFEMLEAFTGNRGPRAGGMPLLEDGMDMKRVGFSSADEQWLESAQLSLQECARVYFIPPAMVGDTETLSYSNARELNRMLYTSTLGPVIVQLEDRLNAFVLPRVGAPESQFVEFNIEAKLRGSFEEQASIMSTAIGGPWMTRNEGRKLQNLPAVDGGDELITPLNVTEGGQASPQDGGDPPVETAPDEDAKARLVERITRMGAKTAAEKSERLAREFADDAGIDVDDAALTVLSVIEEIE